MGGKTGRLARDARRQMEANRGAVYDRDWQQCVARDHGPCSGGLTLQHRVNRGMGGSSSVGDGPQWYVAMCARHNMALESDAAFQQVGRSLGWSLPRTVTMADDVLRMAVHYPDGWYRLTEDGDRERVYVQGYAL